MSEVTLCKNTDSKLVSRQELDLIKVPDATDTYVPISHFQLAELIATASQDVLKDYTLIGESYGIARKGNQLFAVLSFRGTIRKWPCPLPFVFRFRRNWNFPSSEITIN
ncbi:MAG: hypothetical protein AB9873_13175 [Syntrophobacteraceae bacterium]